MTLGSAICPMCVAFPRLPVYHILVSCVSEAVLVVHLHQLTRKLVGSSQVYDQNGSVTEKARMLCFFIANDRIAHLSSANGFPIPGITAVPRGAAANGKKQYQRTLIRAKGSGEHLSPGSIIKETTIAPKVVTNIGVDGDGGGVNASSCTGGSY